MVGMSHHVHYIFGISSTILAGGIIILEAGGLGAWIWVAERRLRIQKEMDLGKEGDEEEGVALTSANANGGVNGGIGVGNGRAGDEYFALGGISDDEGEDEEDDAHDDKEGPRTKSVEVTSRGIPL